MMNKTEPSGRLRGTSLRGGEANSSHHLVQQLADDWEEGEADATGHAHLDHAWDGASEKAGGALSLHHLHGAIHGALVQLLGRLALHPGLDAILRLRQHHGATTCEEA